MAAKAKSKIEKRKYFFLIVILFVVCLLAIYLWFKINRILHKDQSWIDLSWFESVPFLSSYLQPDHESGSLTIFQRDFYYKLSASIFEDLQFVGILICNFAVYLSELISSILALFALIILVCVCLSVSLYKDTREKKKRRQREARKAKDRNGLSAKNAHMCCEHQENSFTYNKLWWKWTTLIVFLAMLLSIPWEFVRMYQSIVAEKVSQMQAGIPAECLPDHTVVQSMKAWVRWYLSWGQDPCLVYHKALIVDPMWQVPPLMVLSSAFSHCIVYPVEVIFGGLGRAFRLFFSEIPAPWQPVMLVIMVILVVLTLIMAFGYRIQLPMLLKFEPKTPVYLRHKTKADKYNITREKQNLQFTAADTPDSQQSIESSQGTEYSQETQSSQETLSTQQTQDFD